MKWNLVSPKIAALAAIFIAVGNCNAALYFWNATTGVTVTSGSDPNLSVSTLSVVGGSSFSTDNSSPVSPSSPLSGGSFYFLIQNVPSGALNASSAYFELTVTPSVGYAVELNSLSFYSRMTSTGPTKLSFYSSIDGFASALGTTSVTPNNAWATIVFDPVGTTVGANNTAVTFRVYGTDASASTGSWRFDSVSLDVSAVPEPTNVALGLFAGLGGGVALIRSRWPRKLAVA